jgi:hypothetical protein
MKSEPTVQALRGLFDDLMSSESLVGDRPEYVLGSPIGAGYAGMSRAGWAALLVPLPARPGGVARAGGGCVLRPGSEVEFSYGGRKWTQPAAILECRDPSVLDAFAVLALDIADRASECEPPEWEDVARLVDEWYALLARRRDLSQEDEIGTWGEVWFLSQASDADRLAKGWRGPEGGASDFVIGGVCAEIKTSRARLRHSVSQAQVERPMGDLEAYFVSLWVGLDPEHGTTLPALVDLLLARASDPAAVLKRLLEVGYSPGDRHEYQKPFQLLESPLWFAACDVPRVRQADAGVTHLRYMVALDENKALAPDETGRIQAHFHGSPVRVCLPPTA